MKLLKNIVENKIEIKKSKFIAYAFSVFTERDIDFQIKNLKEKYSTASHICYAYILTNPYSQKFFDDGEPSKTAGLPILNVIKKQGLENILIVVVRFFGGIKLGSGGLIRAYSNSAIEVLKNCEFSNAEYFNVYKLNCKFEDKFEIEKLLNNPIIKLIDEDFSEIENNIVIFYIGVKIENVDTIFNLIKNIKYENFIKIEEKYIIV